MSRSLLSLSLSLWLGEEGEAGEPQRAGGKGLRFVGCRDVGHVGLPHLAGCQLWEIGGGGVV